MMKKADAYGFQNERESRFPRMICLEITNVCNMRCIHCPYEQISQQKDYAPKFMPWEVFRKIADEAARFPGTIFRFVCDGEPMMHPDFMRMAAYAKKKNISPLTVTTNGMFLSSGKSEELIKLGVELIEISLDAFSAKTYEKIRIGGDFALVLRNVDELLRLREDLNGNTKIMVSAIDQPAAAGELAEFRKYWEKRVDKVIIRKLTSIGGLLETPEMQEKSLPKPERWPCPLLWRRLFINVDGKAEFCVDDWLDESVIADVAEDDIARIWASSEYARIRDAHLKGYFSQIKKCGDCCDWPARTWAYDYFHALESLGVMK